MGEAKRRAATREERAALAIERDRAAKEARIAAERARWEALTPEQQEAEVRARREREQRSWQRRLAVAAIAGGIAPRFPR
jgi:biopolymer transport protein ExbB/TolQ